MRSKQHHLILLCALTVAGCSPRFIVQDGTDPRNGVKTPIRLDSRTGESTILRVMEPIQNHATYFWEPIHDQKTAVGILKSCQEAANNHTK